MFGHGETFEWFLFIDVSVVKVTASTRAKSGNEMFSESFAQGLLDIKRIIRAIFGAAHRIRVHCKNSCACKRPVILQVAREQNPDIRVTRPGRANDVRVELAGIESDFAVLHPITAAKPRAPPLSISSRPSRRTGVLARPSDAFSPATRPATSRIEPL